MDETKLLDLVGGQVFGVWFLVGAALVFFMQCGFAMVETGFTRAKNAGNIIMKNLMDFCIGTVVFILQTSIGLVLYLTWFSVQRQQRLFPVRWQNEPNLFPIVFIPQSFLH